MDQVVQVGIWGIGRAGYGMIRPELLGCPKFRIVAGCDLIAARAQQLQQDVGATAYTDAEAFLRDPAVQLVVVSTRSCDHAAMAIRAMEAGKDVLVEKPMATCLADVDRLYAVEAHTGRKLVVRHNRRFDPHLLMAQETVSSGVLGDVYAVQVRVGGFGRRADWQTLRRFGGGQLLNWGPHCIDWGLRFIGGRAAEIRAELRRVVCAGDAEDYVKVLMTGPGGAVADIEINSGAVFSQPLLWVQGTRGSISLDWSNYKLKHLAAIPEPVEASPETPSNTAGFGNPETLQWTEASGPIQVKNPQTFWDAVYDRLAADKPFPVTPEQAREVIRVIEAADRIGRKP